MRLYISGPMTGLPDYNYPAFERARSALLSVGYKVLSPHRVEACPDADWLEKQLTAVWSAAAITKPGPDTHELWHWYMRRALGQLLCCDGLCQLDGWQASRGALWERENAKILQMPIATLEQWVVSEDQPAFSPGENAREVVV